MDARAREVVALMPVFAAFVETGQTNAAADILRIPQSTVSRSLTRLGNILGTPVVERRGRGLRLTPTGEALVPHAVRAAAAGVAAVNAMDKLAGTHRGTIRLAFQTTLGERVVPALVRTFLRDNPGVEFELNQLSRPKCLEAAEAGAVEVAMVSPLAAVAGMQTVTLHREPLVLAVHPASHLASRPRVSFAEAAGETFIGMKSGYGLRAQVDRMAEAAGFTPRVAFEGDDLRTLRGLVSAGLGIAVAPRAPDGPRGWVEVPMVDAGAFREIGACWMPGDESAAVVAFRDLLRRRGPRLTAIGLQPPAAG